MALGPLGGAVGNSRLEMSQDWWQGFIVIDAAEHTQEWFPKVCRILIIDDSRVVCRRYADAEMPLMQR